MTESQSSKDANSNIQKPLDVQKMGSLRRVAAMAIGAIVLLIVLGYNTVFSKEFWQLREIKQNQAKWESQHITHYLMSVNFGGYAIDSDRMPLQVEVDNGKVISVVDALGNKMSQAGYSHISYLCPDTFTIPGLFSFAQQTIWDRLPTIDISYNPALGYPEIIDIIPYPEPCCQGFTIEVQNFEVVQ